VIAILIILGLVIVALLGLLGFACGKLLNG
jgi:hypothetical protein